VWILAKANSEGFYSTCEKRRKREVPPPPAPSKLLKYVTLLRDQKGAANEKILLACTLGEGQRVPLNVRIGGGKRMERKWERPPDAESASRQ